MVLSCRVRWHMRGGMRVPYHARAPQQRKQRSRFGHGEGEGTAVPECGFPAGAGGATRVAGGSVWRVVDVVCGARAALLARRRLRRGSWGSGSRGRGGGGGGAVAGAAAAVLVRAVRRCGCSCGQAAVRCSGAQVAALGLLVRAAGFGMGRGLGVSTSLEGGGGGGVATAADPCAPSPWLGGAGVWCGQGEQAQEGTQARLSRGRRFASAESAAAGLAGFGGGGTREK